MKKKSNSYLGVVKVAGHTEQNVCDTLAHQIDRRSKRRDRHELYHHDTQRYDKIEFREQFLFLSVSVTSEIVGF